MASACVNNIGVSTDNFLEPYTSYGWLSPRVSKSSTVAAATATENPPHLESPAKESGDFEFRLDDPVTMLPADELFSDGKLVPLQLSFMKPSQSTTSPAPEESRSPETANPCRKIEGNDSYSFSPKAPRCSSRWRELLGLKKKQESTKTTSSTSSSATTTSSTPAKSIRLFLHRNSKTLSFSNSDPTLTLPLLKDSDYCESLSISSSRISLSYTSSSSHDHDDLPRLSLDADKPRIRMRLTSASGRVGRSQMRRAQQDPATMSRGVSVDSPRMNPSGKVVFQSLERSSSSPSSFNGGRPMYTHRGMERSYSANVVRVTPVLNVPVCSLRGSSKSGVFGFGQLFSSQSTSRQHQHHQHQRQSTSRNKKDSS